MLSIYKYDDKLGHPIKQHAITPDSWINAVAPTLAEQKELQAATGVSSDFLRYGLDPDEGARYEYDEQTRSQLFIFDMPAVLRDARQQTTYQTQPLAIITTPSAMITVNAEAIPLLTQFATGRIPGFDPTNRAQAVLTLFYHVTVAYLSYLRNLNKAREGIEAKLRHNLQNTELYGLMGIQRSLVYFMLSLRGNRNVLQQLQRSNQLALQDADMDLLEDILIENQQGLEMAQISHSIINETAETYSSIINNNMNSVMRFLTTYSIILTIPTLIFSFYGMNMELPLANMHVSWIIALVISLILAIVLGFQIWHRRLF